jgi:phosphoribulokinase
MTNPQLTPELEQRIRAYAERLKVNAAHYLEVSKKDVPFYDKAQARAPYDKMLHPSDIGLLLELFHAQNAELEQYRKEATPRGLTTDGEAN